MDEAELKKWGSLLLIIIGIVLAIAFVLHPDEVNDPNALASPLWGPVHIVFGFGFLALLVGLKAIYYSLEEKVSAIEKLGFGLAYFGSAVASGVMFFVEGIMLPVIAGNAEFAGLLSPTGPLMAGDFAFYLTALFTLISIGFILIGISIFRTKTLPQISGILLFGITLAAFSPPLDKIIGTIGGVAWSIGLIWIGYTLWKANK